MINIKFNNIEKKICLQDKYNILIIENLNYFYEFINKLKFDIDTTAMFYDHNYEQLYLEKKIEVISDYFSIDCSKSKYFYDFIKINKFIDKDFIKDRLNNIYLLTSDLIEEIRYHSFMDINYKDDIDIENLLKSIGISFYNSKNRLENLINYCKLYFEIYKKEIFIFVNLNMYFEEKDITLLIDELYLIGISCIIISTNSNNINKNSNFNKIIIDKDLCEFYN